MQIMIQLPYSVHLLFKGYWSNLSDEPFENPRWRPFFCMFTMFNVQICLVWPPNKVEKHWRCHFLLYQGCPLICQNQILPQIQHGCQASPLVQCVCVCLANVQTCIICVPSSIPACYLSASCLVAHKASSIGNRLKCDSQLYLGWPFWWWKQIWRKIQNGRQTCPLYPMFSYYALILGPNSVK